PGRSWLKRTAARRWSSPLELRRRARSGGAPDPDSYRRQCRRSPRAGFESSRSLNVLQLFEAIDVALELNAHRRYLAALLAQILFLSAHIHRQAHQILGDLIGHRRRVRIGAVGLEAHAFGAEFFPASVQGLQKLAGYLDLIRQQRQPLVAQALDFLDRRVGAQQVLVAIL